MVNSAGLGAGSSSQEPSCRSSPHSRGAHGHLLGGAARTVTGSMHQLSANGKTILLDCGLFQGKRSESIQRNRDFPIRAKDIIALILSHAHVDHCANLPNLSKASGSLPGRFTAPRRREPLAAVMLAGRCSEDSGRRRELPQPQSTHGRDEPKIEPIYDGRDVFRTLTRLQAVAYGKRFTVGKGMEASFVDAGHLLGSAMVRQSTSTPPPKGEQPT